MLTIFTLLMPIASQVHAADPAKGLEINADHTELDKAVKELKDLGVNPTQTPTEEKGTVKTKADVDAKVAEVKADYAKQIQELKKAKEVIEKCNKDTQAYEAEKKKYDEALERYKKAKEQYDKDLEAYNKSMEELKKHNKEDGYLSQPISQNLKFSSEPQAKMSISGLKVYSQSEFDSTVRSWGYKEGNWGYAYFDALNKGLKGTSTPLVAGDSRVILEKGTLTFNGIGHIIKGAKGADAQQESRVLMLSDKARSDANPILLIDENDVTAGHAASIGQVDPEDMYYLMSRGLDKATAERLVVRGFLGSVIVEIPVKEVRAEMIENIDEILAKK